MLILLNRNSRFYIANRLSYALGLNGPSLMIDTACSSSGYALDCAFRYMNEGKKNKTNILSKNGF
jgi:fatty acid synthase